VERWRPGGQQLADPAQRQAERSQRQDLPQSREIARRVDAIARRRPRRLQQADAVVVVQRLDGHARQRGELLNRIRGRVTRTDMVRLTQGESQVV
jgi:hypothetical protein